MTLKVVKISNFIRGINHKYHSATIRHSAWHLGKIALVAIPSDKPKYHSAAPRGIWAYPREWQLVQFCAISHSVCQKFNSAAPRWIFDTPRGISYKYPSDQFQISQIPLGCASGYLGDLKLVLGVFVPNLSRAHFRPWYLQHNTTHSEKRQGYFKQISLI